MRVVTQRRVGHERLLDPDDVAGGVDGREAEHPGTVGQIIERLAGAANDDRAQFVARPFRLLGHLIVDLDGARVPAGIAIHILLGHDIPIQIAPAIEVAAGRQPVASRGHIDLGQHRYPLVVLGHIRLERAADNRRRRVGVERAGRKSRHIPDLDLVPADPLLALVLHPLPGDHREPGRRPDRDPHDRDVGAAAKVVRRCVLRNEAEDIRTPELVPAVVGRRRRICECHRAVILHHVRYRPPLRGLESLA